jgi:FkbM family methyltransferase
MSEKAREQLINSCKKQIKQTYSKYKNRNIVIFGAGGYGQWMIRYLKEAGITNIAAVCDNNESLYGTYVENVLCDNLDNVVKKYEHPVVIICSSPWEPEIREQIGKKEYAEKIEIHKRTVFDRMWEERIRQYEKGCARATETDFFMNVWYFFDVYKKIEEDGLLNSYQEEILNLFDDEISKKTLKTRNEFFLSGDIDCFSEIYEDNHYFNASYWKNMKENEIYCDCGTYNGNTLFLFMNSVKNKYERIYAFEPDPENFRQILERVKDVKNVEVYNMATGERNGEIRFLAEGTSGSCISENGGIQVPLKRLDDAIDGRVSFIKMDIEGAELATLHGAENMIRKYKPKLAICVYHKPLDFYEIPKYLHELVPEYRFSLRHHCCTFRDTVLYAEVY